MSTQEVETAERIRKDQAKKAIALAMQSRWEEAVAINRSILELFPRDLEAYNRLGKALSELGRHSEAREAFQRALEISPHNSIAKKNLDRLMKLGDEAPRAGAGKGAPPRLFIEESGKAGVTSLVNLAPPDALLKLSPAHPVQLSIEGNSLHVNGPSGEHLGQVEPRLAARLIRLIKGGNRYEGAVTSVGERELSVIICEVSKHPSQAGIVSFPSRGSGYRVYLPSALLSSPLGEEEAEEGEPAAVKDWSNDDTEPGDDEAFSPMVHRIINTGEEAVVEEEEEL